MLYKTKEILTDALNRKYGVAYFNATDLHMVRAYIDAAEALNAPVIIGTSEGLLDLYGGYEWMAPLMLDAAKRAKVPVAIHLDHTYRFETVMNALRNGFGSVMFDGSRLSYEENVACCIEVAKVAHAMNVGVEFELGCVGGLENEHGIQDQNRYTDPNMAKEFVERTNADFLAVAIGTVHGVYKTEPKLNLEILEQIHNELHIPLVLQGGSGLSDDDFFNTIARGISKINVYTDIIHAGAGVITSTDKGVYADIMLEAEAAMKTAAMKKIEVFGGAGKA